MAAPLCVVCAQPSEKRKCVKCKTPYCSIACQTVDWKERGHKKECKRLVKANTTAAAKVVGAPRDEAVTPPPSPKPKVMPPVVEGPARGRADVARAKAAAAAATATTALAPEPEHWRGTPRCPICLEDWDVNIRHKIMACCCKEICSPCLKKLVSESLPCPLCRAPFPDSDEEQLARLRRNVENGIPAAICQLAQLYAKGAPGLKASHKKAARLYQRAADLGDVMAMCNLGCSYMKGLGVKIDMRKGINYSRMAAKRGCADANYNLGICMHTGTGVARDDAEACRLMRLAADTGYTNAQFGLGVAYVNGSGVARDVAEGCRWFERAAAKGHEEARAGLARIRASLLRTPT